MIKEFKITLGDDDLDSDLLPYTNAANRDAFLFHMNYNFWRQFKHRDDDATWEEVKEKFFECINEYKVML